MQTTNTLEAYRKYLRDCSLCLYAQEAEAAIVQPKSAVPAAQKTGPAKQTLDETAALAQQVNESKKPVETQPDDGLIHVPGGTYTMGCTAEQGSDCSDDEKPAHPVTLADFYIGKYEVTQALWRSVMGSDMKFKDCDQCPVERVSWDEVQNFLTKLNAQTGRRYRLPTEAEWEYAARGGALTKGYKYSGSNNIDDVAWYNSNMGSHPVGSKKANELGLFDMSGNVSEWCGDWYETYYANAQTNPSGPISGSKRVYRGGSLVDDPKAARVAHRSIGGPTDSFYSIGLRLSRTF